MPEKPEMSILLCMRFFQEVDLRIAASVESWVVGAIAALILLHKIHHITNRISHLINEAFG